MNPQQKIIRQLSPRYFWDVDLLKIHDQKNKRFIIERILSFGSIEEIGLITRYYGRVEVMKTIRQVNYLDPKTLHFASRIFKIPKSKFACTIKNASKPRFWNS